MRIFINADLDDKEQPVPLEISNDGLNNLNFIEFGLEDISFMVSLDDLYAAILALRQNRKDSH